MRRITLTAFIGVVAFATYSMGCLDRKPAPVCPVPIEIASTRVTAGLFDGVDLLVVVDNSGSMAEEQQILSTGFFTLINSLTRPIAATGWEYPAVENMRVAIVSSDMGLQYGEARENDPTVETIDSCEDLKGDDGFFLGPKQTVISVGSGVIACEGDGPQCPSEFSCNDDGTGRGVGLCTALGGITTVNCTDPIAADPGFAETVSAAENPNLTVQVACLAQQGTEGCGVEQQLEASVRGLESHPAFLAKTHLLAVLVVSDEEDCSIEDKGLFQTPEWLSGATDLLNIACNCSKQADDTCTDANEQFLFPPQRYYDKLVELKNAASAVIFAGIIGVPPRSVAPGCEGPGGELGACLDLPQMQIKLGNFQTPEGWDYTHFEPACTRMEGTEEVTSARPGRRYVKVAQLFGPNAYIYSICNADWSPAMEQIAAIIARQISATCYGKKLTWSELPLPERNELGCPDCGKARCDVVVNIPRALDDSLGEKCPDELYEGLSDSEKKLYLSRKEVVEIKQGGSVAEKRILCPLPKLPAPRSCEATNNSVGANDWVAEKFPGQVGWYYCENTGESFEDACRDEDDNDQDGKIDCADDDCADCINCNGTGTTCSQEKCRYGVEITPKGKDVTTGYFIDVQCLQQFRFEDQNCQEDSREACNNNKDDDGNGVKDCNNGTEEDPHLADANCCPMTMDANKNCQPQLSRIRANCGETYWRDIPACNERISELGCTAPEQ